MSTGRSRLACIAGAIAEAFYGGVPENIQARVEELLTPALWKITQTFCERFR